MVVKPENHLDLVAFEWATLMKRLHPRVRRRMGEDLRAVGLLALVYCARHFRAARGARFAPWARVRVRGAMRDLLRRQRRWTARRVPLTDSLGTTGADEVDWPADANIAALMASLTGLERVVIRHVVLEGWSQVRTAGATGRTRRQVRTVLDRAITKMRERV